MLPATITLRLQRVGCDAGPRPTPEISQARSRRRIDSWDAPSACWAFSSATAIRRALDALSEELAAAGEHGELIVVGGAALVLLFGSRETTKDVDAYFLAPESSRSSTRSGLARNGRRRRVGRNARRSCRGDGAVVDSLDWNQRRAAISRSRTRADASHARAVQDSRTRTASKTESVRSSRFSRSPIARTRTQACQRLVRPTYHGFSGEPPSGARCLVPLQQAVGQLFE